MRTIGLIGGMTWHSTLLYYKYINEEVYARLGGKYSAKCIVYSHNFQQIEEMQRTGRFDELSQLICNSAINLEKAGADCIALCANTIHIYAPDIINKINIPLIHIGASIASALKAENVKKALFLGTNYIVNHLQNGGWNEHWDKLEITYPEIEAQGIINYSIFNELCYGNINFETRDKIIKFLLSEIENGVNGIILGCTELGMIIDSGDYQVQVFDSLKLHTNDMVDFALK